MINQYFDFKSDTELIGIELELISPQNCILFPQYTIGLHAWLLKQVQQNNPELSQHLHDAEKEKAFTISGLEGELLNNGKNFQIIANRIYRWQITALSRPVVEFLFRWLDNLPKYIPLHNAKLSLHNIQISLKPNSYKNLSRSASKKFNLGQTMPTLKFSFLSPTSFRRQGHHFPLPVPVNLFHSYLRRWNIFSQMPIPQTPFLEWIDREVIILRHSLESSKVLAGKKGAVTGFTGAIELGLSHRAHQHLEYVKFFYALGDYAPYCGTGHKTTFGLGTTQLGWSLDPIQPINFIQNSLSTRIAELNALFLSKRKRTGGTRAQKMAATLATILARRETGESLIDIAEDLEMPYQTVKTYVKLARAQLKN